MNCDKLNVYKMNTLKNCKNIVLLKGGHVMEKRKKDLVIKIVLTIVVTLVLTVIVHVCRNYFITKELTSKMFEYNDSTNCHITEVTEWKNHNEIKDTYLKNDKMVTFWVIDYGEAGKVEQAIYKIGGKMNIYTKQIVGEKTAKIGVDAYDSNSLFLGYNEVNLLDCFTIKVKDVIADGIESYQVSYLFDDSPDVFFEKETGLPIRVIDDNYTHEIKYELDKVEDSIFIEPSLDEYEIIEK